MELGEYQFLLVYGLELTIIMLSSFEMINNKVKGVNKVRLHKLNERKIIYNSLFEYVCFMHEICIGNLGNEKIYYRDIKIPKKEKGKFRTIAYVTEMNYRYKLYIIKIYLDYLYRPFILTTNYGYIKGVNGTRNILISIFSHSKANYILDIDIAKYFDNISHKLLMEMLDVIGCNSIIKSWIYRDIRAPFITDRKFINIGIKQGSIISPTLSNIYLIYFDQLLTKWIGNHAYHRYVDNIYILAPSMKVARFSWFLVEAGLEVLGLAIKTDSSIINLDAQELFLFGFIIRKVTSNEEIIWNIKMDLQKFNIKYDKVNLSPLFKEIRDTGDEKAKIKYSNKVIKGILNYFQQFFNNAFKKQDPTVPKVERHIRFRLELIDKKGNKIN